MSLLRDALAAALAQSAGRPLAERLLGLADAYMGFADAHPTLWAALFEPRTMPAPPAMTDLTASLFALLEGVLREAGCAALARQVRADTAINMAAGPDELLPFGRDKGHFNVVFEASGAGPGLAAAAAGAARPGATVVQLGLGGAETAVLLNLFVSKGLILRGTLRFHERFGWAAGFIARRRIDVRPLLSATLPVAQVREAFDLASDRKRAMKVQLAF